MPGQRFTKAKAAWVGKDATGPTDFLGLSDTPANYTGSGLYVVRVNAGETALEFVDLGSVLNIDLVSGQAISQATRVDGTDFKQEISGGIAGFRDTFEDNTLRPFWLHTEAITSGNYTLDTVNNQLVYVYVGSTDDNWFRQGVEGDFDYTVQFDRPANGASETGIMFGDKLASYAAISYIPPNGTPNDRLILRVHGSSDIQINPGWSGGIIWLRLVRKGNVFTGYYKRNSSDVWTSLGSNNWIAGSDNKAYLESGADGIRFNEVIFFDTQFPQSNRGSTKSLINLTDAATISLDASLGDIFSVTITADRTLGNPSNALRGQRIYVRVKQDGTGGHTLSFDTKYRFSVGAPSLPVGAGDSTVLTFVYDETDDKWDWTGDLDTGEVNTASNVGSGSGVFKQKTGLDLEFKSLVADTSSGLAITPLANTIEIDNLFQSLLSLNDTPAAYTGKGSYILRVNAPENAIEFADLGPVIPVAGQDMSIETVDDSGVSKNEFIGGVTGYYEDFSKNTGGFDPWPSFWRTTGVFNVANYTWETLNNRITKTSSNAGVPWVREGVVGDFDYAARLYYNGTNKGSQGIKVEDPKASIYAQISYDGTAVSTNPRIRFDINGSIYDVDPFTPSGDTIWLRLVRKKNVVYGYYKIADSDAWILLGSGFFNFLGSDNQRLVLVDVADTQYDRFILYDSQFPQRTRGSARARHLQLVTANQTIDTSIADIFRIKLTANTTINAPLYPDIGKRIFIVVKQLNSAGYTINWDSAFRFPGSTPQPAPNLNDVTVFGFAYDDQDGKWDYTGCGIDSGEINTASNVGTSAGVGIFKQKTGVDLELKSISPATTGGIGVNNLTDNVEIENTLDGKNVGTSGGVGIYKQRDGSDLEFKSLKAGSGGIDVDFDALNVEIDNILAGKNVGTSGGIGLYKQKNGSDLEFKSLKAGTVGGISISELSDQIIIDDTTDPGEDNTASNVGTSAGVGIFKQKTGVDLELKSISPHSSGGVSINGLSDNVEIQNTLDAVNVGTSGGVGLYKQRNVSNIELKSLVPHSNAGIGITALTDQVQLQNLRDSFLKLLDTPASYAGSGEKILRVNSGANAVEFAAATALSTGRNISGALVKDSSSPYIEADISYPSYEIMGRFLFPGSSAVGTPSKIYLVGGVKDSGKNCRARIYDLTNSNVIAELTGITTVAFTILDMGSLSSIPSSAAIWEIQGGKGQTDGDNIRVGSYHVTF